MNLEQFATQVSSNLPSFEARFWWLIILFSLFIVTFGLKLIFSKKYTLLSAWYCILTLGSVFLVVSPIFLGAKVFEYFDIESSYFLQIPLWIMTLSGLTVAIVYVILKLKKKSYKEIQTTKVLEIFDLIHLILIALSLLYTLFLLFVSLYAKPYVVLANDESEESARVEMIKLETTVPVRKDELEINISPDQEYSIEYDGFLFFEEYITGITITPVQNYPPETKVITYFTGLSNIWPGGRSHEQNLDFFTPPLPKINSTNFPVDAEYIPVNTEINMQLTNKTGDFVYWDVEIEPQADYEIIEDGDNLRIKLLNLKQGTDYKVTLSQAERIFKIEGNEDIRIGELIELQTFEFQTTPPPNIEGYNRKEGYMSTEEPLEIRFSDEISGENITDYFVIEPEIEGELEILEDGKVLRFTPKESFSKNTDYKVTIKSGLKNRLGGELEEDNVLDFTTPGYVYVIGVYPRNYSSDVDKDLSSVRITFNQPVNKSSAEEHFSISPSVGGRFSWSGNTMYYIFSSVLSYGTRYSVRISDGVESLYGYDLRSDYNSVFTTEEEVFVLNVPQYYQEANSFACNLVATKMVLGYKGKSVSIDSIKSSIGVGQDPNSVFVEGYGVHWGPISSYISSRGVTNSVRRNWNVTELVKEVSLGNPVLLFWYNGYTTPKEAFELEGGYTGYHGMHSEVVVGFVGKVDSPSEIILNDPWRGRRYMALNTFKGLWSYLGNTAIIIY